jgi:low temperature requirement protein LtrA
MASQEMAPPAIGTACRQGRQCRARYTGARAHERATLGRTMAEQLTESKEKKVEYVELIYDLIFVFIIGRNNALLHNFSNGFVDPAFFLYYVMTTLAVIQIWNYTTYYINIYGSNSVRNNVFLFSNMFLLYFVGVGTRVDWQAYHASYHVAWALILVNIGIQYLFELREHADSLYNRMQIIDMASILFIEAAIVLSDVFLFRITGTSWASLVAIVFGVVSVFLFGQQASARFIDFPHLSERAMLYVVFSFGEMVIAMASYFEGELSVRSVYFALMAFLIVLGLFLSYGVFYDRIIDRERKTNGLVFMMIHIVIIFAMNNITNGLEFMREDEISLMPKLLFLVGSMVLYFVALFALGGLYAKARCAKYPLFCRKAAIAGVVFAALVFVLASKPAAHIALSVLYVLGTFALIRRYGEGQAALEAA